MVRRKNVPPAREVSGTAASAAARILAHRGRYSEGDVDVDPSLREVAAAAARGDSGIIGAFRRQLRLGPEPPARLVAQVLNELGKALKETAPPRGRQPRARQSRARTTGVAACVHRFRLEEPNGRPAVKGRCLHCGAERKFTVGWAGESSAAGISDSGLPDKKQTSRQEAKAVR